VRGTSKLVGAPLAVLLFLDALIGGERQQKLVVAKSGDSLNYVFPTRTDGVAQQFGW
jgi:hypothetical protein